MRQARTILSTYSADAFGVCSALFELGGMIVMHDASGCNSTYTTHDEPRWYDTDSLLFISGLTEMEAILGDDSKVLADMLSTIRELKPEFAVLTGTPIPMMTGCDLEAIAAKLEREAGIPCFGFQTNGMRSYLCGASEALAAWAKRMVWKDAKKRPGAVNVLGATPLDFSLSGTVDSATELLKASGWEVVSTWAMGSSSEALRRAGEAEVNLVISGTGMKTAEYLREQFGTPWVAGLPVGRILTDRILRALRDSAADGQCRIATKGITPPNNSDFVIIGEAISSRSLAAAIQLECGAAPRVIDPLEQLKELSGILSAGDAAASEEEEIRELCRNAKTVIADPLYRPILPADCRLIPLPHEAFSGRMFRPQIPDLVRLDLDQFLKPTKE